MVGGRASFRTRGETNFRRRRVRVRGHVNQNSLRDKIDGYRHNHHGAFLFRFHQRRRRKGRRRGIGWRQRIGRRVGNDDVIGNERVGRARRFGGNGRRGRARLGRGRRVRWRVRRRGESCGKRDERFIFGPRRDREQRQTLRDVILLRRIRLRERDDAFRRARVIQTRKALLRERHVAVNGERFGDHDDIVVLFAAVKLDGLRRGRREPIERDQITDDGARDDSDERQQDEAPPFGSLLKLCGIFLVKLVKR